MQTTKEFFFLKILPLGLLVLLVGGIGGVIWLGFRNQTPLSPRFDTMIWQGSRGATMLINPRSAMVPDLQRRYLHRGMNHDMVISLLGQSDNNGAALCYALGSRGSLIPPDQGVLCVIFDQNAQLRAVLMNE